MYQLLCFINQPVILCGAIDPKKLGDGPVPTLVLGSASGYILGCCCPVYRRARCVREKRLHPDLAGVGRSVPSTRGMALGQVRDGCGLSCFLNLVRTLILFHVVQGIKESLFLEVQLWC